MNKQLHVIVGAGATGTATALQLADSGTQVRIITRSGSGPNNPDIERVAADAANPDSLQRLTKNAEIIYNCAGPPYQSWATEWPPLANSLLKSAEVNEAVLVTLSNLYPYPKPTKPMKATDQLDAPSKKGAIKAKMWSDAKEAHDAGRIRATEVRASDFIGPGVGANGQMGDRVVPKVLAGKSVSVLGRTDATHSWTAIEDVARTLITVATNERAWGRPWHVPTAPPMTQTEIVHRMCQLAGVDPVKVKSIPSIALTLAGITNSVMREVKEISYQFEHPFVIDSAETTEQFGITHTPIDTTLKATLHSYQLRGKTNDQVR